MTQPKSSIEIKAVPSFSQVLENEEWSPDLKRATEAGSVAIVEASEQPAPVAPRSTPRPR
jgi:hypothetical protein